MAKRNTVCGTVRWGRCHEQKNPTMILFDSVVLHLQQRDHLAPLMTISDSAKGRSPIYATETINA
ncbi:hypothetical protein Tcan_04284 [Toxocara canis]|uniref:Uncharacterized protein n=1 Tax=Toxocara canis TaxID=6265 RepID=A0A0B2VV09_TOXCA|nr:hypothetical protein Tcan_04284 [Toxocara canis]